MAAMAHWSSMTAGLRNLVAERDAEGKRPKKKQSDSDSSETKNASEPLAVPVRNPHGVVCTLCKQDIGLGVRYRCISCADVDVCEQCRNGNDPQHSRKGGKHLMLHIPESSLVADTHALSAKSTWRHEGWSCSHCKVNPIVGERFYCPICSISFCRACSTAANHASTHPLTLHQELP